MRTHFCLFLIFFASFYKSSAQSTNIHSGNLDSLVTDGEKRAISSPKEVIKAGEELIKYGKEHKLPRFVAYGNYLIARGYRYANEPQKEFPHLNLSIVLFKNLKDYRGWCVSLKELGFAYSFSDRTKEVEYYMKALEIANQHQLVTEKGLLYNNMGVLYDNEKNYKKAITYYEEALLLKPNPTMHVILLQNIAKSKKELGLQNESLNYYRKSVDLAKKWNDSDGIITGLCGISSVLWQQKKYQEILDISFEVLEKQKHVSSKNDQLETLNRIGLCYLDLKEPKLAIVYFRKALLIAEAIKYPNRHFIYANLAFAYEEAKDYKSAYNEFITFKALEDSLEADEKNRAMKEILAKYEAEKQEQKIVLLQRDKQLQSVTLQKKQSELERSKLTRDLVVLAALLLLLLLAIVLIFYRLRMRNRTLLETRNEETNRQKTLELIRDHEIKAMVAHIEGRDKERLRISQELHDSVAGSLAGIKLQMRRVTETVQAPDMEKIIHSIDGLYDEVRTISHDLSPHQVTHGAFVDLLRSHLKQTAENGSFAYEFTCHPEKELNALPDHLKIEVYRIVQELLANIIRHAQATAVEIQFNKNEESVNLMVEDAGKGFDSQKVQFGVGLKSIQTRVANIKGTLHIESVLGRGTIVNIDIPVL